MGVLSLLYPAAWADGREGPRASCSCKPTTHQKTPLRVRPTLPTHQERLLQKVRSVLLKTLKAVTKVLRLLQDVITCSQNRWCTSNFGKPKATHSAKLKGI